MLASKNALDTDRKQRLPLPALRNLAKVSIKTIPETTTTPGKTTNIIYENLINERLSK